MVAYSFKPRFIPAILAGAKGGTIRAVGLRRHALSGDDLQLYTGMRTKRCALILRTVCVRRRSITMNFKLGRVTAGMDRFRTAEALDGFARFDGFADFAEMRGFWRDVHDADKFEGVWVWWLRPTTPVEMGERLEVAEA